MTYTLTYFNGRGLAEVSRLLLAAAGQSFKDVRLEIGDASSPSAEWLTVKASSPFGQVPLLEVDGHVIAQSAAIERFLARRFGFLGANEIDAVLIDSAVEAVRDIRAALRPLWKDEPALKEYLGTKFIDALRHLDSFAAKHGSEGHLYGSKLSYADIFFAYTTTTPLKEPTDAALAHFPRLQAVVQRTLSQDNIAAYLKTRPVTPW